MAEPTNAELLSMVRALWDELDKVRGELKSVRGEVGRLKQERGLAFETSIEKDLGPEAAPEPAPLPASAKAPPPPPEPPKKPEPWFEKPAKPKPGIYVRPGLPAAPAAPKPAGASWSLSEKFIGEKLLQYAGMVILALGVVFFLIWTAAHAGPEARVLIAAAGGAALILAGAQAQKRPPYDQLAGTLIGGGWTVLYITIYAAYHFEPTKVLDSPALEVGLLLAAAGCMIAHALSRRSRALRLYAVALTYGVLLLSGQDVPSFDLFLILFGASTAVAVGAGEADVLLASLAGYYLNYVPVYFRTIAAPADQRTVANFIAPFVWILGAYLFVAVLPLIPKARERLFKDEKQGLLGEAALLLNSALFALVAGTMGRIYFGVPHLSRAAVMAAFFAVPSLLYTRLLSRRSSAAGFNAVIALGLLAAAIFEMPDPMWKLLAWIGVSCGWVWVGLALDQPVWRAAGLAMAMLTFGFYWNVAIQGAEARRQASMALFVFTGLSYFFSRFHRLWLTEPFEWEKPSKTLWIHAGSVALVLGLWGVLDAAPFLCALVALAALAEFAAVEFEREDLWHQAALVELAACVYSFFVDYGADAPVWGLPARVWTTAVLLTGGIYLYAAGPVSGELAARWEKVKIGEQRRWLSFGLTAAAAFAVYKELDGRARLPVWALGALALYWLGRQRRETHLKTQGVLLAAGAAIEAGVTYLMAPAQLLSPLTPYQSLFYWGSCAALVGGLFLAKSARWDKPSPFDRQAAGVFGLLPVVLGASYLAKELDSVQLTLAWTGLGLAGLVAGLGLDCGELRLPALGLLGICVGKALLFDTANLPLPNRVASFVGLGLVLLFGSSLYVRAGSSSSSKDEKTPPSDPG